MSAIPRQSTLLSPEENLAGELTSPIKHEFLGGVVHAMAGGKNVHHKIASNILVAIGAQLRGKPCRPYNSDAKVRLTLPSGQLRFYYPDVQVVCDPNPDDETFHDRPNVVVEVLSRSTRKIDEGEKLDAYLTIPSLETYLLVDSERKSVVVYQRAVPHFSHAAFHDDSDAVRIPQLGVELTLAEIYENVVFPPPSDDE